MFEPPFMALAVLRKLLYDHDSCHPNVNGAEIRERASRAER